MKISLKELKSLIKEQIKASVPDTMVSKLSKEIKYGALETLAKYLVQTAKENPVKSAEEASSDIMNVLKLLEYLENGELTKAAELANSFESWLQSLVPVVKINRIAKSASGHGDLQ